MPRLACRFGDIFGAVVTFGLIAALSLLVGCGSGPSPIRTDAGPADGLAGDVALADGAIHDGAIHDDASVTDLAHDGSPPGGPVGPGSKPVILSLSPEIGPSEGLTTVEITGIGFAGTVGVFFGESPALDLEVLSDYTVRVATPPRPPGIVDVSVRVADAEGDASDIVLPLAYRYLANVQVHQVQPNNGPSAGGSLVTITGNGFKPDTTFIFGDRLAIDPLVLDEFSASMHTPPGTIGRVDVRAANADGSAMAAKAWQYTGPSTLLWVAPGTSPIGGGAVIRLHGTALLAAGGAVSILGPDNAGGLKSWAAPIVAAAGDGSWIEVTAPAITTAGSYDVRYVRKGQVSGLKAALTYINSLDPATGQKVPNTVVGLAPASAPVNETTSVAIHVAGPLARQTQGTVEVRVSSKKVPVLWHDVGLGGPQQTAATIIVALGPETWTVLPTQANVRVDVGYDDATKVGGFTWLAAVPKIAKVTPALLDVAGGTPFTVHWGPLQVGFGQVVGVRIGALFATNIASGGPSEYGANTATGLAPKGSAGPADVRLILSNGDAVLVDAVTFGGGVSGVAAVAPSQGAVAGGSLVDLVGSGLDKLDHVFLGGTQATELTVIHPGLARIRTPPGEVGPADLQAIFQGGATQVLTHAYVYFDPIAGNYGTWGAPIDRDVNVTVLQTNAGGGRVEGATVIVERGEQVWTKLTDANGQVVISAPKLVGPVTVSASKQGYTAASVVKVSVRNVTVRLRKDTTPPPSSGNGTPPDGNKPKPFPDGVINGTVSNASKYTQLPMGDCKTQPVMGGNCKPCTVKADCLSGQTCELLHDPLQGFDLGAGGDGIPGPTPSTGTSAPGTPVPEQRYCLSGCVDDKDCPGDFECRAVTLTTNAPVFRCTPRIGFAQTRCATTSPSMWGGNPNPGPKANADISGKFSIASRLGDLAVVCRSGYVEKGSGDFIPLMIGITRGLHMLPGGTLDGVQVTLTTPMSRTVRVRLDRIPMGDDVKGAKRYMVAALNLDPEGYIQVADVETMLRTDVIELPRQPWSFQGALSDVRYDLYGGLANASGGAPTTVAAREDVKPSDADHLAWWPVGEATPVKSAAWAVPVNAMHTDGYSTVAVGDRGWIGVWGGAAFTQQQSPVKHDLYAVWMAPDGSGDGWAGGEGGVLLRRNNLTGWQASPTPVALPPAGSPVDAGRIRAIHGRAHNDVWLLSGRNELYHWDGLGWSAPFAGPLAPPKPRPKAWGLWKEDPRLRALFQGNDGAFIVVGDGGYVARGIPINGDAAGPKTTPATPATPATPGNPAQPGTPGKPAKSNMKIAWQLIASTTPHTLHAAWGITTGDFWVVGDAGTMKHYSNGVMTDVATSLLRPLYGVIGTAAGVQAVGGLGAWVHVDLNGKLTDVSVKDLSVDLKAIAMTPGGTVAAGQPMIVMGPYLELPYIVEPKINGPMGKTLKWTAKPGVTPTLHMIRIANSQYKTLWELYVKGDVTKVDLPDFEKLGAFNPLPGGQLRIRLWRIYAPGLDIDHYNHKQLSVWKWVSYAYNWVLTSQFKDLSGVGLPTPSVPGGAEPGKLPSP